MNLKIDPDWFVLIFSIVISGTALLVARFSSRGYRRERQQREAGANPPLRSSDIIERAP